MIAEIKTQGINVIIKPLFNSIYLDDLWEIMYDCGFSNMVIINDDGYYNAMKFYGFIGRYI